MPTVPRHTLAFLGVTAEEERIYRAVLPMSGRHLEAVAQGLEITTEEFVEQARHLEQLGLVAYFEDRVTARTPTDAIADVVLAEMAVIEDAAARLGKVREAIPRVRTAFRRPAMEADVPLDGEVKIGGNIPAMLTQWIESTSGDMCWMRPDQWAMPHESALAKSVAAAIADGRPCRAIYPIRALEEAPEVLQRRARTGEQVRVLPEVPTRLAIIGPVALLQESFGLNTSRRLVVREPGLMDAVQALFDLYWWQAVEVPGLENPQAERRRVMRRLLLQQLAEGAKDERIARALGLSLRTVRRRVSELLDEFGVETRFQAGVEAVRRGLL